MIEYTFRLNEEGGAQRDIAVRIHAPTPSLSGKWPWTATVEVDGHPSATPGMDPLDAIEKACQQAAILLRGQHGNALAPPIDARDSEGNAITLITTFTPADGTAKRIITLRISALRPEPDGESWTVAVEILGFKHDLRTRLMQVNWAYAIRDAGSFIASMLESDVELAGGGTFDPPLMVLDPSEAKKKKGRRKGKKGPKE